MDKILCCKENIIPFLDVFTGDKDNNHQKIIKML